MQTDLTEEQRAALQAFAEIDADGGGDGLTADEIYRAPSKNDGDVSLEHVKELVAKADTDGNGTRHDRQRVSLRRRRRGRQLPTTAASTAAGRALADIEPEEPRAEEAGAGRGGLRWRVSSRPGRAGGRRRPRPHLEADDLNTLRDALSRGGRAAAELVQTSAADALEARLEIVEVDPVCGAADAT